MEKITKYYWIEKTKLNLKNFIQDGGTPEKTFKIEYDGHIYLEFKKITKSPDEIEIYLSNEFENDNCITISINPKLRIGSVQTITAEKGSCFHNPDFILKKPGSFYLEMTLKLLKKYKKK